jgi:lipoprotein Spr
VKNLIVISVLTLSLSSCSLFKKGSASKANTGNNTVGSNSSRNTTGFIENISIKTDNSGDRPPVEEMPRLADEPSRIPAISPEMLYELQFKYAILLDVPVEELMDHKLIEFLENWYGTRYRMGGRDKTGVDCSAFVQSFMSSMYGIAVPRTSQEQYQQSQRIKKDELKEGDLVFFKTQRRKGISHVGVYLRNNKFVHASTSSGVMISDLGEEYFARRYAGCGRYRNSGMQGQ